MRTVISALFLCFSLAATAQEVPDFDVHGFASYTLANAPKHDIGLGVSYRNDYFDVRGAGFNIPSRSHTPPLSATALTSTGLPRSRVMRVEGSNTELSELPRRAATNRVGLRVSYSW